MTKIHQNKSLKALNTFGIDAKASQFASFSNSVELQELLAEPKVKNGPLLILGGGSNLLFTKDFEGVVLKNDIKGIQVVSETDDALVLEAGAGENWHDFVTHCVEKGWGGIENLSLIPGNVGASPMQNIGAYGVEIKDVFFELDAVEVATGKTRIFSHEECAFGYRESVFKWKLKGKYIITAVRFNLTKNPILNTSYGIIEKELKANGVTKPTIKDVSRAVCSIRNSKLPNPKEIGNAGSFFKNPVIDAKAFKTIKQKHKGVAHYILPSGSIKLAAGWLIDNMGWKGKTVDDTHGVHKNQALVLVNYGGATGQAILDLSEEIIVAVKKTYGVNLEREVNIY